MNTITVYQAIARNPGLTLRQLSEAINIPYNAVRRAKDRLSEQKLIEPCGTDGGRYKWLAKNR